MKAQQARQAQAETYSELGHYLQSKKDYKEAINAYKKALAIFQDLGEQNRVKEIKSDIKQSRHHIWNAQLNQIVQSVSRLTVVTARFVVSTLIFIARVFAEIFITKEFIIYVVGYVVASLVIVVTLIVTFSFVGSLIEQTVILIVTGLMSSAVIVQKVILVAFAIIMSCFVVIKVDRLLPFSFFHKIALLVSLGFVLLQPSGNYFKIQEKNIEVSPSPYIQPIPPSTAPLSGYRVICPPDIQELNVRQLPSLSASVISTIPCNTTGVQIIEKEARASGEVWVKIKYRKIQGWSVKRFLSKR